MKKISMVLFLISTLLLFSGCATFKSDMAGKYAAQVEAVQDAPKVSLLLVFSHLRQTKGWDAIPKLDGPRQRIGGFDDFLTDALTELDNVGQLATFTEYASDVNNTARRAQKDSLVKQYDYVLNVKIKREKSFVKRFLATLVSTVSATIIPMPYGSLYSVKAELFGPDGKPIREYTRSVQLTTWYQMGLLFVYPFHPQQRKKEELYVSFLHNIFKQINDERALVAAATGK